MPSPILAYDTLAAGLIIIILFGVAPWGTLSLASWLIIIANCMLWVVIAFLDLRAYRTLDAVSAQLINTLTLIIGTLWGVGVLNENCSMLKAGGIVVVIAAIAYTARGQTKMALCGVLLKLAAAVLVACASIVDKYLSGAMPIALLALLSYAIPGSIYALLANKALLKLPSVLKANPALALVPFLGAPSYYLWLKALSEGGIITTLSIGQALMVFVFLLEFWLLKFRERTLERGLVCGLCLMGALAVCAG